MSTISANTPVVDTVSGGAIWAYIPENIPETDAVEVGIWITIAYIFARVIRRLTNS